MEKMLKDNLELNINAILNGKPNKMNFDFKLLETLKVVQFSVLALEKFEAAFTASLSKVFVDNRTEMTELIKQSSFIKESGEVYEIDVKLDKGIKLNNQPLSVEELQSMLKGADS